MILRVDLKSFKLFFDFLWFSSYKKRIKNNRPISPEAEENDSESDTEQPPSKVKKSDEQGIASRLMDHNL